MNYDPILLHQSLESQHASHSSNFHHSSEVKPTILYYYIKVLNHSMPELSHSSNFHHLYNACETASATRIAVNKKKAANVLCETNTPSVAFAIVQEECNDCETAGVTHPLRRDDSKGVKF